MWSASRSSSCSQQEDQEGSDKVGQNWAENVDFAWDAQILSLDGGGVRGYSTLLVLKALMHEVWLWELQLEKQNPQGRGESRRYAGEEETGERDPYRGAFHEDELLPCHYFDFMFGRSSGGLIATLLGRLRMTVTESLEIYRTLTNDLLGNKGSGLSFGKGKHEDRLVRAIQEVIGSRCSEHEDCDGKDDLYVFNRHDTLTADRPFDVDGPRICHSCCLTATNDANCSEAHLFRTYVHHYTEDAPSFVTRYNEGEDDLKMWQVVSVISAESFHSQRPEAQEEGSPHSFKDGGIRENNPSAAALSEFHALYSGIAENPALLLSVGTGRPDATLDGSASAFSSGSGGAGSFHSLYASWIRVLGIDTGSPSPEARLAEGETLHAQLRRFAKGEHTWYKRLNVSHGTGSVAVDDWVEGDWQNRKNVPGGKTLTKLEEATRTYLERELDPSVDSYAPPKVILSQIAEKLVRHRRAREYEGGERWQTFVGKHLRNYTGGKAQSVFQAEANSVQKKQGERICDDVFVRQESQDLKLHTLAMPRMSAGLDLDPQTTGHRVLSSSITDLEISETTWPAQDCKSIEQLSPEESLLKSVLEPTETIQQVERAHREALDPLFSHLRCSSFRVTPSGNVFHLSCVEDSPSLDSLSDLLQTLVDVLKSLSRQGLCQECLYFFREEDRRILRAEPVHCRNIELVCQEAQIARKSGTIFQLKSMTEELLEKLKPQTVNLNGSNMSINESLSTLCLVWSLLIVSYARSHCWQLDERLVPFEAHQINIGTPLDRRPLDRNGGLLTFRKRALGCLNDFLGAELWALGGSKTPNVATPCQVSITLTQFADLWGPVWTVPVPENSSQLLAVHTEDGILYCSSQAPLNGKGSTTVQCHWAKTIFTRRPPTDEPENHGSCFAVLDTSFSGHMIPFDKSSNLLIGGSSRASDNDRRDASVGENALECQTQKQLLKHSISSRRYEECPQFMKNSKCGLDFEAFLRDNSREIRIAGTAGAKYLPEAYQMSFTAGQYIGVGGGKTFKRRPASTMKQRIVDYCSKPIASMQQILELWVGLEVSACSGNAQRISLWHALTMAYGTSSSRTGSCEHAACDPACAKGCWGLLIPVSTAGLADQDKIPHTLLDVHWTKESKEYISGLIGELSLTGLLDDSELHCLVPPCRVFTKTKNPEWSVLLKDTEKSACFAVLSNRCLTYDGRDLIDGSRKARKCCNNKRPPTFDPLFCTSILLRSNTQRHCQTATPYAATFASLDIGQKILVNGGHLIAKNDERYLQLLSYRRQRLMPWAPKDDGCQEHLGQDANHKDVVRVSIM